MSQSISTSSTSNYTLLTENASPLERALEKVFTKALDGVAPPLPELRDANKIPRHLLPHLAAERQVTEWNPSDPEYQKRTTAKNQKLVFKKAGTIEGIGLAVEGLGGDTTVQKWFEYGGPPYQMKITNWSQNSPTQDVLERTIKRVDDAKSLRDTFIVGLGFRSAGKQYVGGGVTIAPRINIGPWVPPSPEAVGFTYVAGSVTAAMRVHIQ